MEFVELPTNDEWDSWRYILPTRADDQYSSSEYGGTFSVYGLDRVDDVTAERIARVDAWHGVSPEGYGSTDFVALCELADGTWATCTAWSDTTGWGCQCEVTWRWARTRDDAIRLGLDAEGRRRLRVALPSDVTD